jgi:hypothetical protein
MNGNSSSSPEEANATGRPANDLTMSVAGHQTLRVLDGSYVLDRPEDVTEVIPRADVLAVVFGPDGSTVMRATKPARMRRRRCGTGPVPMLDRAAAHDDHASLLTQDTPKRADR